MKIFNSNKITYSLIIAVVLAVVIAVYAQQKNASNNSEMSCPMMGKMADKNMSHEDCPMMKNGKSEKSGMNMNHHDMVMKNGEKEMGFSQAATTHHFLMLKDGGAIQIEVNDATDTVNRDKIRTHLMEIAKAFQNGIFTTPFAIHGQVPAGADEMENLKSEIKYAYEETENGARVRISTANPQALAAIHAFLKFQIEEHQTGDSISVQD